MKTKELIKKYWFVVLVAILLVVFIGVYLKDSISKKPVEVSGLKHDGKDVIYTLGGDQYYYAEDLYDSLYETAGSSTAFISYFHALLNEIVPSTDELEANAANQAAAILQNYDEETIMNALSQSGYSSIDDLTQYCIDSYKYSKFMEETYTNGYDEYVKPVMDVEKPRYISHILIKVADVETNTDDEGNTTYTYNATDEEKQKLDTVLEKLKEADADFAVIATEYSDDGSASNGGSLGLVTASSSSQYVVPFAESCMELENGQVSEVVETEFGWHIIKCEIPEFETLLQDSTFNQLLAQYNPNLDAKLILAKADELGYEVVSDDLKKYIEENLEAE